MKNKRILVVGLVMVLMTMVVGMAFAHSLGRVSVRIEHGAHNNNLLRWDNSYPNAVRVTFTVIRTDGSRQPGQMALLFANTYDVVSGPFPGLISRIEINWVEHIRQP